MSRIDILPPSTITVFAGDPAISSLEALPPYGITISDPSGGTFGVTLTVADTLASLTASGAFGATIAQNGNVLSVTGNNAQVNAALASLQIDEPASGMDALSITVIDPLELPARTTIAIAALPTLGPTFVAPPLEMTVAPEALDAIGGLTLADPFQSGLAAMGFGDGISLAGAGDEGTLRVILSVGNGVLLLPGFDPAGGITATGLGTGSIALTGAADELAAMDALLAGLDYVGPAGTDELQYAASDLVNGAALDETFGRLFLRVIGRQGGATTLAAGTQTIGLGGSSLGGALSVTGILVMQSTAASPVTLAVAPGASFAATAASLTLAGTSLDFGAVTAPSLDVEGALLVADGMSFAGPASIGTAGHVDASGLIDCLGAETLEGAVALSLAAGAVFDGNGTLLLGNAGAAGAIEGPGTLLAGAGQTLLIAGGSVGGGAQLDVAAGGVIVLGPVSPLYGIFDTTPLTIDNSVTLAFTGAGDGLPVAGGYADSLAAAGGAFVISGAQVFSGIIEGFAPGDALILPNLANLNVVNAAIGSSTFGVIGTDQTGATVSYTVLAATPLTLLPETGFDAAGDPELVLRPPVATITAPNVFQATKGTLQPLQALDLELTIATSLSLALTLTAQHGTLSEGSLSGSKITIAAANLAALNRALTSLAYTGTGVNDTVTISSNSADLGLADFLPIQTAAGGTVNAYSGLAFTEAQAAAFAVTGGLYEQTAPVAAGEVVVTGTVAFNALMQDHGLSGTALLIDDGGVAVFGDAAAVSLTAGATIGDAGGAGSLVILGTDFSVAGNVVLAASALAAGSVADLLGDLTIAGSLAVGAAGQAGLTVLGSLSGHAASLGTAGTLLAGESAALTLTTLADAGSLILETAASLAVGSLAVTGRALFGGLASVTAAGQVAVAAGAALTLGAGAVLDAASLTEAGTVQLDGLLTLGGTLALSGPLDVAGGTILTAALLDRAGTLAGYGVVDAPTISNTGDVFAAGGTLVLAGNFTNSGLVNIESHGTLDLVGPASGSPLFFNGQDALLTVNDPLSFSAGVAGLINADAIDLVGVAPSLVSFAGGAITITNSAGQALSSFVLDQPATTGVTVIGDGAGGADVTINGQLPCFARGTRLLTPQGYRAVETLRPGDPVITASGAKRPVRWVGWRTLDFRGGRHRDALPVQIEPGAFADGVPARPIMLSPQHAVCVPGGLIPAGQLVNGVTIRRLPASALTYYHVELDRHDALLTEGLACESYFDDGNRGGLYREIGRRCPAPRPMAPYLTAGSRWLALRRQLHERVLAMGYAPQYAPRLSVLADGVPATAVIDAARVAHIRLPRPARRLTLISPATAAAETDPQTADWRAVSLCWVPTPSVRFGDGFYERAAGDRGIWMAARGEIELRRASARLDLTIAAVGQSWGRSFG